jgi:hypothetical protein
MEFKVATLSNAHPAAKPATVKTDAERTLFVRQFQQSGMAMLAMLGMWFYRKLKMLV